jgi:mannose-6-phosphate isomerase-like protein (cupin superfamily)
MGYISERQIDMIPFSTTHLPTQPDAIAPDGSQVRLLLQLERGSLALFTLLPGQTSLAVAHRTIEELWYFVQGHGEMWRRLVDQEEVVAVEPGVAISLPCGTRFQFRCLGDQALSAVGVSMPPWPGEGEAYEVPGLWQPTVKPG